MRITIETDETSNSPTIVANQPATEVTGVETLEGGPAPQSEDETVLQEGDADLGETLPTEGINAGSFADGEGLINLEDETLMADLDDDDLDAGPVDESFLDDDSVTVSRTAPSYWESA